MTVSLLFVCLGNICRSPMAEGAMRSVLAERGLDWHVDSAGTGNWHVGKSPDPRAQAEALRRGVDISALRARQVSMADFARFTHIFALDADNLHDLRRMAPSKPHASVSLLLDWVDGREGEPVGDPYYGADDGFARTWDDVSSAARSLAAKL